MKDFINTSNWNEVVASGLTEGLGQIVLICAKHSWKQVVLCCARDKESKREESESHLKYFILTLVPVIMLWLDTETKQSGSSVVEQHHMQYTITLLKDKSKIMNRTAIFIYLKIH